jgi:hypothetical protein
LKASSSKYFSADTALAIGVMPGTDESVLNWATGMCSAAWIKPFFRSATMVSGFW